MKKRFSHSISTQSTEEFLNCMRIEHVPNTLAATLLVLFLCHLAASKPCNMKGKVTEVMQLSLTLPSTKKVSVMASILGQLNMWQYSTGQHKPAGHTAGCSTCKGRSMYCQAARVQQHTQHVDIRRVCAMQRPQTQLMPLQSVQLLI